jgi:esterase/lipase superfamily enzyme
MGLLSTTVASRRTMVRGLLATASMLGFGGCSVGRLDGRFEVAELSANPTVLLATTRKPVNDAHAEPWFGPERAARMTVARVRLKPPTGGRFSLAAVGLQDEWGIEAIETVPQVADLVPATGSPRDVLMYVHGFNQSFQTAVNDAASLSDGIKFRGETMVFSWPSKASLLDYVYDRESAMWSRDALERTFAGLIASPAVGQIHVVGHSVGTMLAMEGLRQIYLRRGNLAAAKIGSVVFASPDIDLDVFTSSVRRIGPLARKITVITATNDRALVLSGWIAGGVSRVGAAEKRELEKLGLRVIDASQQGWGIINHDLFLSNAQIRKVIRAAIDGRPVDGV